jgi:hypothetical protein
MRQPSCHRFQIGVMLGESLEHRREAARQVADLVAGVGPCRQMRDAPARIDRGLGFVAQPPDAHREPRREGHEEHCGARERAKRKQEKPLEGGALHRHHRVRGLLGDDGAGHLVCGPDGMRGRHDHRPSVARMPALRRRCALQRRGDIRPRGQDFLHPALDEVLGRPRNQPADHEGKSRLPPGRLNRDVGRASQAARGRDHLVAGVDNPDT